MFFKSKFKTSDVNNSVSQPTEEVVDIKEETLPVKQEEEWIWVEGYKGTDKDMKCRDYQYELNYHYKHNDEVKLCESGFHFCTKLSDVFKYYELSKSNRFFKVKGLVKKKDYDNRDSLKISYGGYVTIDTKLSAKEIIFIEELKFSSLKEYINGKLPFIETEDEYYNCKDYTELSKTKFLSGMNKLGFSELYSYIKYSQIKKADDLYIFLKRAESYKEEGVSKDTMIYLLETKITDVEVSMFSNQF